MPRYFKIQINLYFNKGKHSYFYLLLGVCLMLSGYIVLTEKLSRNEAKKRKKENREKYLKYGGKIPCAIL